MSIGLEEIENPKQRERWEEVLSSEVAVADASFNQYPDDPYVGLLCLDLNSVDAQKWGIYGVLWIDEKGKIAEAMVNHPFFYDSFSDLLTAAAARTAAS